MISCRKAGTEMAGYTVEGLEEKGYRGYVRNFGGKAMESRYAMMMVAMLANWNRYHLIFELDRKNKKQIIRVRDAIFTTRYPEVWIEREMHDDNYDHKQGK